MPARPGRPTSGSTGVNAGERLILPLTVDNGLADWRRGAVFRIERRGDGYLAKWISPGDIFSCEGARDPASEQALAATRLGETGRQPVIEHDDFPLRQHNLQSCLADGRLIAQFILAE